MHIKQIIGAAGFFSFGALVAWAVTADHYEQKVNKAYMLGYSSADAAASQRSYQMWLEKPDVGAEDNPDQGVLPLEAEIAPEMYEYEDDREEIPPGETPQETRSNLQSLIDTYTANPEDRDEFADLATRAAVSDQMPPFVISRATFAWDEEGEHYEKITLTYFPRDRVLLDDEEDPIDDIPGYVGWRSLNQFGGESEDPDVVFVRNRRLMTDFEVVKEDDAELPLHVKYGMPKEEFRVNRAAGLVKLRQEDQ